MNTLITTCPPSTLVASTKRPRVASTTGGMAPQIGAVMHTDRTSSIEDQHREIRRLWRELGTNSYLCRYFGISEDELLTIVLGKPSTEPKT